MYRTIFRPGLVILLFLMFSCSKDYRKISPLEITEMLPELKINRIEVVEGEIVRLHVANGKPYQVDLDQVEGKENFISHIRDWNENASVEYIHSTGSYSWFLIFYQLFQILILLLIILQVVLLWFSLKRIIRERYEPMEKLVHLVIVLFAPVIGPLVYLTSKKSS